MSPDAGGRPPGRATMADETELFTEAERLRADGRLAEAAALYRAILDREPRHLAAAKALADALDAGAPGADAGAARAAARRIEAEGTYNVAKTALDHGRFDVAVRCYRKVLDVDPDYHDAVWGLAEANYGAGNLREALSWYREYLDRFPADPEAAHMVAALGDGPKPARASDAYVRDTFDHYAGDFDRQLLEDLDYRAPKLLLEHYRAACPEACGSLDVLDAGCGTGLAGIEFRPLARRLDGVDLSPRMLDVARGRGIYDGLEEAEIGAAMRARPAAYDLIVAADVLCYIGDLSETLRDAATALRPGGTLVFSVEVQAKRGYVLTDSGRYAHKPAYVRKCAAAAGLREIAHRRETLRTEYGEPVAGYITALAKG